MQSTGKTTKLAHATSVEQALSVLEPAVVLAKLAAALDHKFPNGGSRTRPPADVQETLTPKRLRKGRCRTGVIVAEQVCLHGAQLARHGGEVSAKPLKLCPQALRVGCRTCCDLLGMLPARCLQADLSGQRDKFQIWPLRRRCRKDALRFFGLPPRVLDGSVPFLEQPL